MFGQGAFCDLAKIVEFAIETKGRSAFHKFGTDSLLNSWAAFFRCLYA